MVTTSELIQELKSALEKGEAAAARRLLDALVRLVEREGVALAPEKLTSLLRYVAGSGLLDTPTRSGDGSMLHSLIDEIAALSQVRPVEQHKIDAASEQLYAELLGAPIAPSEQASTRLVKSMRAVRSFDWLAKISDRLISTGADYASVRLNLAQALIDSGHLNAAISGLQAYLVREDLSQATRDEAVGLIGRANKQIYVNHVRRSGAAHGPRYADRLRDAVRSYARVIDPAHPEEKYWHAINIVALVRLAEADGVSLSPPVDGRAMAAKLVQRIEPQSHWEEATLGEAYLALKDDDQAAYHYKRFAEKADLFALASATRQLEQVWRAEAGGAGPGRCLAILKDKMIRSHGKTSFTITSDEARSIREAPLETRVPGGKHVNMQLLRAMVEAAGSIAWIKDRGWSGRGTGFLIRGGDLVESLGDEPLLLTNTHVICTPEHAGRYPGALRPQQARIQFELSERSDTVYQLDPEPIFISPSDEYDAVLLRFSQEPPQELTPRAMVNPDAQFDYGRKDDYSDGTPVMVIGHPGGQEMAAGVTGAIENNLGNIVDIGGRTADDKPTKRPEYLHYNAPTLPGNSGSPVFMTSDPNFPVIGLHHAGYDTRSGRPSLKGAGGFNYANEGITLRSIKAAVADRLAKRRR